jgi:CO/xanthine dehydrogenase FAD-binding subunit
MPGKPDQIMRPKTIEEAGALLEKMGDEAGLLWLGARVEPPETWARASMIDLSDLNLDYIEVDDQTVVIGGGTPLQRLVEHEALDAAFGGLIGAAARRLAHYGLRNLASVGGAVSARQGPPELTLALLSLGAEVVFAPGQDSLSVEEFRSESEPARHGVLTQVRIARLPAASKGWGLEWLARSPMDQALAAACAVVEFEDDRVSRARTAVAGVGWPPSLVDDVESHLEESGPVDWSTEMVHKAVLEAVEPVAEFRASGEYQAEMMARLAVRAVAAALKKAGA